MTTFKTLFGIKESQVKKTCVLMPLIRKDILSWLGLKDLSQGKLYRSANAENFTLIHTGMGPALSGDAALYIDKTPCEDIILFGSCGLVKETSDLDIGSLVTPEECYSMESFTDMLSESKIKHKIFYSDRTLLEKFPKSKRVTCATLGSLKLEEGYIDIFKEKNIQVVDMECSAVFSAAKYVKRNAVAFFYITDIVNKKPFYGRLSAEDKLKLEKSIRSACHSLCEFTKKNLNA